MSEQQLTTEERFRWRVGERNGNGIEIRIISNNYLIATASVPSYSFRGKEWQEENENCIANAQIIAAAPAMLAALKEIAGYSGKDSELDYNAAEMRKTAQRALRMMNHA